MDEFHDFCNKGRNWMTGKIYPMSKRAEEMTHMDDYIRREDAIAEICKDIMGGLNAKYFINRIPAADVRPVVHNVMETLG